MFESDSEHTTIICAGTVFSFDLFIVIMIVSELTVVTVLYFRILRIIFKKRPFGIHAVKVKTCSPGVGSYATTGEDQSGSVISVVETRESTADDIRVNPSQAGLQPRSRIVAVFIAITIALALSYIPKVVIFVMEVVERFKDEHVDISSHPTSLFRFFETFYIFSTFINPLIYGCMNKKYRNELRTMCCSYKRDIAAK